MPRRRKGASNPQPRPSSTNKPQASGPRPSNALSNPSSILPSASNNSQRARRGPGRKPNPSSRTAFAGPKSVPPFSALSPSTPVSIILKKDQGTGLQVHGIISLALSRGDHPQGVKVRLRDGRVGRVQAVVSQAEGLDGEDIVGGADAGLGSDGETGGGFATRGRGEEKGLAIRGRGGRGRNRDIREEEEAELPPRGAILGDFFPEERSKDEVRGGIEREWSPIQRFTSNFKNDTVICPVCMKFEGDEDAVRYHVEDHYREDEDG